MADEHDVSTQREDLTYIRDRVDSLYSDVSDIKVKLSGFMGRAAGIAAVVTVLTTGFIAVLMALI